MQNRVIVSGGFWGKTLLISGVCLGFLAQLVFLPAVVEFPFRHIAIWKEITIAGSLGMIALYAGTQRRGMIEWLIGLLATTVIVVATYHLLLGKIGIYVYVRGLASYLVAFATFIVAIRAAPWLLGQQAAYSWILLAPMSAGVVFDAFTSRFAQYTVDGQLISKIGGGLHGDYRASFIFLGATSASLLLSLNYALLLFSPWRSLRLSVRIGFICTCVLTLAGIAVSYARVGYLGATIITVGFLVASMARRRAQELLWIMVLISCVAITLPFLSQMDLVKLQVRNSLTSEAQFEANNLQRVAEWMDGLQDLQSHPLTGRGVGTGQQDLASYVPGASGRHYESSLLAIANEGGIFVLFAITAIPLVLIVRGLFALVRNPKQGQIIYAISVLISILTMLFINPIFGQTGFSYIYGLLLAFCYHTVVDGWDGETGPPRLPQAAYFNRRAPTPRSAR